MNPSLAPSRATGPETKGDFILKSSGKEASIACSADLSGSPASTMAFLSGPAQTMYLYPGSPSSDRASIFHPRRSGLPLYSHLFTALERERTLKATLSFISSFIAADFIDIWLAKAAC